LLKWALEPTYQVVTVTSAAAAIEKIANEDFDVVLTDLGMVDMSGLELCERILGTKPDVPVIMVTGAGQLESAIAAMRAGAYDFITKPVDTRLLAISVARAKQHCQIRREVNRLREATSGLTPPEGVIGSSRAMGRIYETILRIADSDASVLVRGETGSGKEVVARRIHATSRRRDGPFIAINCAAVPANLLESELFGHARGAFTDAKVERTGLFVQANRGTLFLDEIGELPLELQPKLLRALQERRVRPVGSNTEVAFDARIITASNRGLEEEVDERHFRQDLFYRINVVSLDLPPLREREGDVLELAQHFLAQHAARRGAPEMHIAPEVAEKLIAYHWPGNVRELENCIARATAFARHDQVTVQDLPEKIRSYRVDRFAECGDDPKGVISLDELARRYITRVIKLFRGNKSRAAEVLGIDRRTLYRRIEGWEQQEARDNVTRASLAN
jgi:DNA-binding NtrC family response regulator